MVEKPAGFWVRLFANLIDGILLTVAGFFLVAILGVGDEGSDMLQGLLSLIYSIALPVTWYGYTLGKRALGIRILKVDGEQVGVGAMLLRTIVAGFVYGITLGIALIVSIFMVIFRKDKRSVHDMIANTYVTYKKPVIQDPYHQDA